MSLQWGTRKLRWTLGAGCHVCTVKVPWLTNPLTRAGELEAVLFGEHAEAFFGIQACDLRQNADQLAHIQVRHQPSCTFCRSGLVAHTAVLAWLGKVLVSRLKSTAEARKPVGAMQGADNSCASPAAEPAPPTFPAGVQGIMDAVTDPQCWLEVVITSMYWPRGQCWVFFVNSTRAVAPRKRRTAAGMSPAGAGTTARPAVARALSPIPPAGRGNRAGTPHSSAPPSSVGGSG